MSQKPWGEMFNTSAAEVPVPMLADFILSFLNDSQEFNQFHGTESLAYGKLDGWLEPEFRFTVRRQDMHMHPGLFSREKIEPIIAISKNRRTHNRTVTEPGCTFNRGLNNAACEQTSPWMR